MSAVDSPTAAQPRPAEMLVARPPARWSARSRYGPTAAAARSTTTTTWPERVNAPVSGGAAQPSAAIAAVIDTAPAISRAPTRSCSIRTPRTSSTIRPSPSDGWTIATEASERGIAWIGQASSPQRVPSSHSRRRTRLSSSEARRALVVGVRRASSACSVVASAYIVEVSPPSRIAPKTLIDAAYGGARTAPIREPPEGRGLRSRHGRRRRPARAAARRRRSLDDGADERSRARGRGAGHAAVDREAAPLAAGGRRQRRRRPRPPLVGLVAGRRLHVERGRPRLRLRRPAAELRRAPRPVAAHPAALLHGDRARARRRRGARPPTSRPRLRGRHSARRRRARADDRRRTRGRAADREPARRRAVQRQRARG